MEYILLAELKIFRINAISRLDAGSFDSLLAKQNVQGGIRDVTKKKESNIAREKDGRNVPLTLVMRS